MSRRLVIPGVLTGLMLTAGGCGTPLVLGDDRFGIGLFSVTDTPLAEGVHYTGIEGFGLLVLDGRVTLGYVDHQRVVAAIDGRSYHVRTPIGQLAVGAAADEVAMSLMPPPPPPPPPQPDGDHR